MLSHIRHFDALAVMSGRCHQDLSRPLTAEVDGPVADRPRDISESWLLESKHASSSQ
jgi:hypothetical protein